MPETPAPIDVSPTNSGFELRRGKHFLSFQVAGKKPSTVYRIGQTTDGQGNEAAYVVSSEPSGHGRKFVVQGKRWTTKKDTKLQGSIASNVETGWKSFAQSGEASAVLKKAKPAKGKSTVEGGSPGIYVVATAHEHVHAVLLVDGEGKSRRHFAGASVRLPDGSVSVRLAPVEGSSAAVSTALKLARANKNEVIYNLPLSALKHKDRSITIWDYERMADSGKKDKDKKKDETKKTHRPRHQGVMVGMGQKDAYVGDEAQAKRSGRRQGVMVGMAQKDCYVGDEAQAKRGILQLMTSPGFGIIFTSEGLEPTTEW